jgi:hypothetical protein
MAQDHNKAYLAWIHELPCTAAGHRDSPCSGYITAHHVRRFGSARVHARAVPLCVAHHLHDAGPDSVERGKARFEKRFGIDLEELILHLNAAWQELTSAKAA